MNAIVLTDNFSRADSILEGGPWHTVHPGTWGISSNHLFTNARSSMSGFEIVQTGPEGEGKQPYFLRLVGGNGSDKIVHSEQYAHRSGAEGAFIAVVRTVLDTPEGTTLSVKWNDERTKGYVMVDGWMASHAAVAFVNDSVSEAKAAATARAEKKAAAKAAEAEPAVE